MTPDVEPAAKEPIPRKRLLERFAWFEAVNEGDCIACGGRYTPGMAIRSIRDQPGAFIADCCGEEGGRS